MAGKITDLDAAVSVADVDQVELLQGGANKRATAAMIRAGLLPLAGGTMTGQIVLFAPPTLDLHPSTKLYADDIVAAAIAGLSAVYEPLLGYVAADADDLALYQLLSAKDQANGYAGLDSGGKVSTSQLPALALTSTQVVASEAAMLALTAEPGDLAVRTDLNKTFILVTAPASVLGNWQELLTPTDLVSSVAGKTGAVTLDAADINTALAFTAANAAALNASNLTTGIIPDARFPAVLPAISGANLTNLPGVSGVVSDAATNTVSDALILRHETSGTAAAGFGTGLLLQGENAAGTMKSMASIDAVYISAADGAEHTQLVFKNHFGGVESTLLTLMQQYADTYLSAPGALVLSGGSSVQVGGSASVVYLTTGYSNSWLLDSAAAFKPSADITYDLGTPANRVKDIHAMSVKTSGRSYLAVPNSAPTDGDIANGAFSAYLDEAGNALKIRVRYSDGTLKLATIALA